MRATADDPRAVRRLAKTLVDHQSDAMLTMTATYQVAHIGTYALPARVDKGAHIAGYALPEIGLRLSRGDTGCRTLARPVIALHSLGTGPFAADETRIKQTRMMAAPLSDPAPR